MIRRSLQLLRDRLVPAEVERVDLRLLGASVALLAVVVVVLHLVLLGHAAWAGVGRPSLQVGLVTAALSIGLVRQGHVRLAGLWLAATVAATWWGNGASGMVPVGVWWAGAVFLPLVFALAVSQRTGMFVAAGVVLVEVAGWLPNPGVPAVDDVVLAAVVLSAVAMSAHFVWYLHNEALSFDVLGQAEALGQANRELLAAEEEATAATRAKDDFLDTVSHELRRPLAGVVQLARVLHGRLDGEPRHLARTIERSGLQLLSVVQDLIDMSDLAQHRVVVRRRPVDLHEIVDRIKREYQEPAARRGIELYVTLQGPFSVVRADGDLLMKALRKLVDNALKFTRSGRVVIGVNVEPHSQGLAVVEVAVADTGIGIPEDKLDRMFERFTQAQQTTRREFGGVGLGLSFVASVVELLGGEVTVASEVGRGSTFRVRLPVEAVLKLHRGPALAAEEVVVVDVDGQGDAEALCVRLQAAHVAVRRLEADRRGLAALEHLGSVKVLVVGQFASGAAVEAAQQVIARRGERSVYLACPESLRERVAERLKGTGAEGVVGLPLEAAGLRGILRGTVRP